MSDNKPVLKVHNGIHNVSYQNRLLYKDDISRVINSLNKSPDTLYIVISPLLFRGLDELDMVAGSRNNILLVENNIELYNFSLNFTNTDTETYSYIYSDNRVLPDEIIRFLKNGSFRRAYPVYLNSAYFFDRNYYKRLLTEINNYIQRLWKNRLTLIHMGRLWSRNIFANLSYLTDSLNIGRVSTDRNVLVAAAGESLELSIPDIKNCRDKIFLIAVDTALGTLLSNKIIPDLCIILEAQHANLSDFYFEGALSIPAVFDLTSSPEVIRKHNGDKYFILSEYTDTCLIPSLSSRGICPPLIPPLGSVGIAALYIALKITSSSVFFTGLDFSFTPDKYHSNNSPSHIMSLKNWNRLRPPHYLDAALSPNRHKMTDKSGRIVFSDPIMESYSERIIELENVEGRIVDTGEYGLEVCSKFATLKELSVFNKNTDTKTQDTYKSESNFNIDAVRNFISNENIKLNKASEAVIEFLNGKEIETETIISLLNEIDYCFYFFPDYRSSPLTEKSFLKRFLVSCRWFSDYLQNICTNI